VRDGAPKQFRVLKTVTEQLFESAQILRHK
jgi:hypothetical protein